jgi:magnesium-transporting ATPase (P-type)
MFTGDHLETAIAVAKECNIISETDLEAAGSSASKIAVDAGKLREYFAPFVEINEETDEVVYLKPKDEWEKAFKAFAGSIKVVARCTPEDKLFFVKILQKNKAQVAVVGDSMADAAALKEACVGIVMKSACDVAKDSSDIILLESEFAHIRTALMWGRNLNRNMQRFLQFQLTINLSISYVTILGGIFGHPPLNVI